MEDSLENGEGNISSEESKSELSSKDNKDEDLRNMPPHFKAYTIQDQHTFCEKAKLIIDTYDNGVYKGPIKVKEINLEKKEGDSKANVCFSGSHT